MDPDESPVRDYGSFAHPMVHVDDIEGHHTEIWQHAAMNVGLNQPRHKKRHHRRHHHRHKPPEKAENGSDSPHTDCAPPSERVQYLLGQSGSEKDDVEVHDIFCEMDELRPVGDTGERIWKETARWIKFEEDVEEEGERWSKPFVATLSLHALFELRRGIMSDTVMLDLEANTFEGIIDLVIDQLVAGGQLDWELKEQVQDVLLSRHRHLHDRKHSNKRPSFIDLARRNSDKKLDAPDLNDSKGSMDSDGMKRSSSAAQMARRGSFVVSGSEPNLTDVPPQYKFNEHFAKKIPAGAEASNMLVGEVDFLQSPIMAFTRLASAEIFGELTEVPVPTRFMFILLGPVGGQKRYHEIGRSIATLMSDEVFHEVAYRAGNREDLLAGIDEFLDQVTVLPPGEWDPNIRIEPPKSVPSQDARKKPTDETSGLPNGLVTKAPEPEDHTDLTLQRTGRFFGGLVSDIKRKAPWYLSDFRDGIHIQCLASLFFIYFACLTPIVTFGGLLGTATENNLAAMESLLSGAICGISYHLFAGQPLTVIGSTGPVLVFETIVFNFSRDNGLDYLAFRFWIGIWMALILMIMVAFDLSALVKYITRFTEESFAMLIALIFIVEAVEKLLHINNHYGVDTQPHIPKYCHCVPVEPVNDTGPFNTTAGSTGATVSWTTITEGYSTTNSSINLTEPDRAGVHGRDECHDLGGQLEGDGCDYVPDVFLFSCLLFFGTFILSYGLKFFRNTRFMPTRARSLISDFAVFLAIVAMVIADIFVGLDTPKLLVPATFRPTRHDRGWIINPLKNDWWWIPAAILPSLLATILIFMDQQITAVIVNRKENKLRKGGGYHLDLFLITIQIVICSVVGTPWFVAATVLSITHVRSLTRESESSAPGERPKFLGVREQRLTGTVVFILVGVSTMMASVLKYIPMPVLYGVFLYMGVSSIKGIQLMQRFLILFMPSKYQPDYMFLRHVRIRRVHLFTLIQVLCLAILWGIKTYKKISIIFPLMVLAMCFVRKALDWLFTRNELQWLDDIMPESHKREKEDKKKKKKIDVDDDENAEPQMIEMEGGLVSIPLKEGKTIDIPVDRMTYDPVSKKLNLTDEMSKTAIWKQLDSSPKLNGADYSLRSRKPHTSANTGPVRFRVGDDEVSRTDDETPSSSDQDPNFTNC